MKGKPLVYIVLPVYNWEKYFLEQLMSLYYQDYTNWFLIIVNDWSTDSSEAIARDFVSHYNLHDKVKILQKENWWVNSAVQKWLEEIKKICDVNKYNSLISYCDCDDVWARNKLSVQVEYMVQHPECGLLFHNMLLINEYWEYRNRSFLQNYYHNEDFIYIATMWNIPAVSMMFRSRYVDNLLPMPIQQWMAQDVRTALVLSLLKVWIHYLDRNLFYYRQLPTGLLNKIGSNPKRVQNQIKFNYFLSLENRYPNEEDIKYIKQYTYDRFIKWYNKWYSSIRIYLLMLFKYPKIFFLWLKAVFYEQKFFRHMSLLFK